MSLKYHLKHYENNSIHRLQIREMHCICESCIYCNGDPNSLYDGDIFCEKQDKKVHTFFKKKNSKGLKIRKHFCMFYKRDYLKPRMNNKSLKHSNLLKALKKAFDKTYPISRVFTAETRLKINKVTKILVRIKNMINEENDGKPVEIESVVEILDNEEDLDKKFIEEIIDQAVKEGTLCKSKEGYIIFTEKNEESNQNDIKNEIKIPKYWDMNKRKRKFRRK